MARIGVLLIHGFLGSPREWTRVSAALEALGYATRTVTQPGHGANPARKLMEVGSEEILAHALQEYEAFARECDRVYVVGHSLGGLCALFVAGNRPEKLAGAMAFASPYRNAYLVNHFPGLLRFPFRHLPQALRYFGEFWTGYERPTLLPWHYPQLIAQTARLFDLVTESLPKIDAPLLLAHSPYDMAIPYAEMEMIACAVNRPDLVQTHTLSACGHQVFVGGREYDEPLELILRFLESRELASCAVAGEASAAGR